MADHVDSLPAAAADHGGVIRRGILRTATSLGAVFARSSLPDRTTAATGVSRPASSAGLTGIRCVYSG